MTHTDDVNDEGNAAPVTLDLTDDRAYSVITHALSIYAGHVRGLAGEYADVDQPDTDRALAQFELADIADGLREQIEHQIDDRTAPQEESE